jgi:hypothetical protein
MQSLKEFNEEQKDLIKTVNQSTQTDQMNINNLDPLLLEEIMNQAREKLLQEINEESLQNLNLNENNDNIQDKQWVKVINFEEMNINNNNHQKEEKHNENIPQVEIRNNIKQEKTFDINTLNETVKMLMDETYMDQRGICLDNEFTSFKMGNALDTFFFIAYTLPFSTPEYHTGLIKAIVADVVGKEETIDFFQSLHFDLMEQDNWEDMKIREPYRHMFEGKLMTPLSKEDEIPAMKAMQTRLRQAYQTYIMELDVGLKYLGELHISLQNDTKNKLTSRDYDLEFLNQTVTKKEDQTSQCM